MSGPIVVIVEADEADPIAYNIYFDEDCTQMTLVPIHPSSASMSCTCLSCPKTPRWGQDGA